MSLADIIRFFAELFVLQMAINLFLEVTKSILTKVAQIVQLAIIIYLMVCEIKQNFKSNKIRRKNGKKTSHHR